MKYIILYEKTYIKYQQGGGYDDVVVCNVVSELKIILPKTKFLFKDDVIFNKIDNIKNDILDLKVIYDEKKLDKNGYLFKKIDNNLQLDSEMNKMFEKYMRLNK